MRPSDSMSDYISDFKQKNQFKHPIVGIHVRRTDKIGTEAKFHSIDEYMYFVDDFYNKLDLKRERNSVKGKTERRVYLATDEPDVWRTEITPYKQKVISSYRKVQTLCNGRVLIHFITLSLISFF